MNAKHALPDPLLSELSRVVGRRLGLHFPRERWGDLERGLRTSSRELGSDDAEACARRLVSAPLSRDQVEILARHLTVGETYFFREPATFAALEQQVLPELLRARAAERRLRLWSAACCTGEEAYSLAILLDGLLPPQEHWHVTLLASDVNPAFLRKARAGVYGEWSFRTTPPGVRARYFRPRRNGQFELDAALRRRVTFSHLNLAEDVYPSLTGNTNAMDLILCRNVLMYFEPEQAAAVIERLRRCLVDGGWLVVSPVEASHRHFAGFEPVVFSGATLYRRSTDSPRASRPAALPASLPVPAVEPVAFAPPEPPPAPPLSMPEPPPAPAAGARELAQARSCANEGRLADAAEWCNRALAADKLEPSAHYLLATVLRELGDDAGAIRSLERTLYLDPGFVLAHFTLGTLALAAGRHAAARRHLGDAAELLSRRPRDELLPESEGLTAGRLAETITSILASVPAGATNRPSPP